ncbi:type VI secretion system baseplate subunit TssG [Serratia sp. DD3]|uniref:type VI secretion system baseplate subunit TssG n=1 Tax=Serratia sp. DD3 TaxID=1410619 RepID=UPI0003C5128C|nr:type VI secretion system baseplate subunit TssG [Serratia sp. DD3]KEY59299.1 type VI secretion protein, family [Serratia sp. DD3]
MEREPQSTYTRLNDLFSERLPYTGFYRFLQWLEQTHPDYPPLGSTSFIRNDPVRLRPHAGMGFPASEFKGLEINPDENPASAPSIRTTFMGLYGVDSPLPTHYIDDIAQHREGYEAVEHFLDIFNHRILTQFYRIWRKHSYPATFESGGRDKISQSLLGLVGLGIPGTQEHIDTPLSRFLALLGIMRQPARTAEGIQALVNMVAPNTQARVIAHYLRRIPVPEARLGNQALLGDRPVIGGSGYDINSTVKIELFTDDQADAHGWLPPEHTLYHDLLTLLRVYLGWRLDAYITLTLPLKLLPAARLSARPAERSVYAGYTAVLGHNPERTTLNQQRKVTIPLGFYQGLRPNPVQRDVVNVDD